MVNVLVIGAGAQGGPCASILAAEQNVAEVRLGDINLETAQRVRAKIDSLKIKPFQLDAGSPDEVISAAAGVDIIFNFTLIKFNATIMKAALTALIQSNSSKAW